MRAFVFAVGCISASLTACGGKILMDPSTDLEIATTDAGVPSATDPFRPGEDWVGTYTCAQGLTNLDLRIVAMHDDSIDDALFQFDFQGITGSYHVYGAFDPTTSQANLAPGDWVKNPGSAGGYPYWYAVGMAGTVSGDSYAGSMTSTACREFELTKQ